jgi:EAL domain-containing protein (putative c-di-GMP-specific phosphodiesterase class I)
MSLGDQPQRDELSIGAAHYPSDAGDYQKHLPYAALALLRSKKLGTGRIDFYDDQLGIAYSNELTLASDIETALVKGHITPHYQPIFDAKTRHLCGLEALVRWENPTRGLLLPNDFSKIFSDRGLSLELSKYMLKAVSKQLSEWRKEGLPIFPININVEASDLLNQSFLSELLACLKSDEILPKNLGIEITENAILSVNDSALIQSLDAIRRLGVRVLLDDFGTGYSSIKHLDHLPITGLKLDKSYVQKICASDRSLKIVKAIVDLATELGLATIAEGIERQEELHAMDAIGCTAYQGFYFAKALSPEEMTQLIESINGTVPLRSVL